MLNEYQLREAVQDYLVKEFEKQLMTRARECIEDTLTKAMQKVTIHMYKKGTTNGICFDITINFDGDDA